MRNLKLSKTAMRELTRLYRGVMVAALAIAAFVATDAKAAANAVTDLGTFSSGTGYSGTEYGSFLQASDIAGKQDTLTDAANAGNGIAIDGTGKISVETASGSALSATSDGLMVKNGQGISQDSTNGLYIASGAITGDMIQNNTITKGDLSADLYTAAYTYGSGSDSVLATTKAVDNAFNNAITYNSSNNIVQLKKADNLGTTYNVYDTTGTANYVTSNAENATYTGTTVTGATSSGTLKGALSETTTQVNTNTATIGAGTIAAGTAGSLTGKTIGTGTGEITVTQAIETLNATNNTQNTSLNAIAQFINGGTVNATTGAYTAGATITATKADGTTPATDLTMALNAASTINQSQNTALGVLNSNGTYKADGLTNNMFKSGTTAGTTLAVSLDNLAGNITAITGGAVNSSGVVENDYMTGVTGINYTALTDNSSMPLATAIGQINKNVGTAVSATYGNIASTKTVNANLDALDAAIGDRQYAHARYVTRNSSLTNAISDLDAGLSNLETRVDKYHEETKAGFASIAALSALVPNSRSTGNTQISVGTGYHRGETGFALGAFHYINDNVLLNIGGAYAGDASTTFRGGVTFGF